VTSPEFALALACAAWPRSEENVAAIRRAAQRVTDWPLFRRIVIRQRIYGLAHHGLTRAGVVIPSAIASAIASEARAIVMSDLAMIAEAVRLKRLFDEHGVPIAFLKGQTLEQLAYGTIGLRHAKDIDILIPPDCVEIAAGLLVQAGYGRVMPAAQFGDRKNAIWIRTFKNFQFANDANHSVLELHWRLSDNRYIASRLPPMSALQDVAMTDAMALPTLPEDHLFLYLCVHGASHCWFRLKWIADIGALIAAMPPDRLERLFVLAKERDIARPFAQAMLLSQQLFGSRAPAGLTQDRALHRAGRMLAAVAWMCIARGGGALETREVLFVHPAMRFSEYFLGGWRSAVAQLRCGMVSEKDWLLLPLPDALSFLYPLIRVPLWLWRSLTFRGRKEPLRRPQTFH
jgi:hypothetical protein